MDALRSKIKRLLVAGAVLLALAFIGLLTGSVMLRSRTVSQRSEPIVGSWKLKQPQEPGMVRYLIFEPDGTAVSRDFSAKDGKTLQNLKGTWSIENAMIVVRKPHGLVERLPFGFNTDGEFSTGKYPYERVPPDEVPPAR